MASTADSNPGMGWLQPEAVFGRLLLMMLCLSAATSGIVLPCLGLLVQANPAMASVCLPFALPAWSLAGHLHEGVAQTGIPIHPVLQDLQSQREEAKQRGMLARLCPARLSFSGG